jgi:hypothetical protein
VETGEFLKHAKPLISDCANPKAGEIIPESGGVRKVRWALRGTGKRGGARVIYYCHNERLPVFLLSAYAKFREFSGRLRRRRSGWPAHVPLDEVEHLADN